MGGLSWVNYLRERLIIWWLSFFLATCGFIIYLVLHLNLTNERVLFYFFQESLNYLLLLSPHTSLLVRILSLKGGFGPFFEWFLFIMRPLKGWNLLHLFGSLKLPYYPVFICLKTGVRVIFFLGVLLTSIMLLHKGSNKRLLLLRSLEGGNLLLITESRETNFIFLFLFYTNNFLIVGNSEKRNPTEIVEKTLYFLRLPISIRFSLKLLILESLVQKGFLSFLLASFIRLRVLGGFWFTFRTLAQRNQISRTAWKLGGTLILRVILFRI